jgi:uncharacterized protein YaaW (UPF0174 family)
MALKFRTDRDLSVLALARHEDLQRLAAVLTVDAKDGKERKAQELLSDALYKQGVEAGDLRCAWKSIAAELQAYGGDSVVNLVRGVTKGHTGVPYREIVTDICERLTPQVKSDQPIMALEDQLLMELIRRAQKEFSIKRIAQIMVETDQGKPLKDCLDLEEQRRLTDIFNPVSSATAAGLPLAAAAAVLPRMAGFLVPAAGIAATAASAVTLLSSPAYRVTVPAVLEVIRIRRLALLNTFAGSKAE